MKQGEFSFDIGAVRRQFPCLETVVNGKPLIYFDTAATAQRPQCVLDAMDGYYRHSNANIHRGVHTLAEQATEQFEAARDELVDYINAGDRRQLVFTRGTTEAVNLVAQAYLRPRLQAGDEILVSHMEHHSNIVPWQLLAEQTGAVVKVIPINERGELCVDQLPELITDRTRMLAVVHVSNALGTINPIAQIVKIAHQHDVPVLVDGAQAMPHCRVDVQALGCDFYCISAHKMYGPTGIGALYGKLEHFEAMPPWHGGGEMIRYVSFEGTEYNDLPAKFEAGTPNIAGVIGFGETVRFLKRVGIEAAAEHEHRLLQHLTTQMNEISGVRIIGTAANKAAVVSFTLEGVHPHDLGTLLDHEGVAIRTGHHCAMPVMQYFKVPATARMSLGMYNTVEEIDSAVQSLQRVRDILM